MLKRYLAVFAVGVLALALALPISISQAQTPGAPSASTTIRIRFVNAANTSTGVDVVVDGTTSTVMVNILSLKASKYETIATAGNHTISLVQTGTTTAVGTPLTFNFVAKTSYTIVLLPDMTWAEFVDNNPAPAAGTSNARVINVSNNNSTVNVAVDGTVPPDFTNIAYKSASATYFNLPVGAHVITLPGTSALQKSFNFLDGHVYSIFVYWDTAKNLPLIVVENDTNFLAGTPSVTVTSTFTTVPTSTSTPVPTNVVPPTPTLVGTVSGFAADTIYLPFIR